jgi:hypothetical protein
MNPENISTDTTQKPAPKKTKWWVWAIFFIVVGAIAWDIFDLDTYRHYILRSKLTQVQAAIDPVKRELAAAYEEKGKAPPVQTVITQANQGKAATPDWAALGFKTLPALPREVSSLSLTPEGEIVVVLSNIEQGIDGTEVRARLVKNAQGLSWEYRCTSENGTLKQYFTC